MDGDAGRAPGHGIAGYEALAARFAKIATIGEAGAVLGWDMSAMMPAGGAAARGDQLATLAGIAHGMLVAAETGDELDRAEAALAGDGNAETEARGWAARNVALMRRAWRRATALPASLVEARAVAEIACEQSWRGARADDDFARVLPAFSTLLGIVREEAALLGAAFSVAPYDALVTQFQPGITSAEIEPVFARYEAFLRDALPAAEARRDAAPPARPLPQPVPADIQERVCRTLSEGAGLDYAHARLDRSLHPFCGGIPDDVRITTRYDESDPARALMGVMHETGHALYERGLPQDWRRQPVGEAGGMVVHESQSLIVEMQACRSDAYLAWLGPVLHEAYGGDAAAYEAGNLARLWRRVERSLIRVDADELTYPAHVILRFRLERAMVEGSLAPGDLPGAWSDGLHALLGIRPPDDRTGCLQDIHWYTGLYGYFPSYSLGAMAAAQLMARCRTETPTLDEAFGRGDLSPLVAWLRRAVHGRGARLGLNDLLREATGAPLDPGCFERHLRERYL